MRQRPKVREFVGWTVGREASELVRSGAMPSEGKFLRGKTRPRTKPMKGVRIRLVRCDESFNAEIPVVRSHLSGSTNLGRHPIMAATPQPGDQASLRGLGADRRRSLMNMWAENRLILFLLIILLMTLLCYHLGFSE